MNSAKTLPSFERALIIGGLGFSAVSLCVFATVAFGEGWLYANLGVPGAYVVWIVLFILLGGAALGSLVVDRWRLPKFYLLFGIAFFVYAAGWMGAYFTLHGLTGEWVGSLVGSILMSTVFAVGFGVLRLTPRLSAILFVANSLGYFAGSVLWGYIGSRAGMLLWGVVYGFCLGAGIGATLQLSQTQKRST